MQSNFKKATHSESVKDISNHDYRMQAIKTQQKAEILNTQAYDYLSKTISKNRQSSQLEFNPPGFNITEKAKNRTIDNAQNKFQLRLKKIEKARSQQTDKIKKADREHVQGKEIKPVVRTIKRTR